MRGDDLEPGCRQSSIAAGESSTVLQQGLIDSLDQSKDAVNPPPGNWKRFFNIYDDYFRKPVARSSFIFRQQCARNKKSSPYKLVTKTLKGGT